VGRDASTRRLTRIMKKRNRLRGEMLGLPVRTRRRGKSKRSKKVTGPVERAALYEGAGFQGGSCTSANGPPRVEVRKGERIDGKCTCIEVISLITEGKNRSERHEMVCRWLEPAEKALTVGLERRKKLRPLIRGGGGREKGGEDTRISFANSTERHR